MKHETLFVHIDREEDDYPPCLMSSTEAAAARGTAADRRASKVLVVVGMVGLQLGSKSSRVRDYSSVLSKSVRPRLSAHHKGISRQCRKSRRLEIVRRSTESD